MLWHVRLVLRPGIWRGPGNYGWMGVDLFFVLSGYLIGSQLLRPYTRDARPSTAGFYLRRAFRVLPAYLTVLLFYFAIPGFREAPGLSPLWQFLTFTENFRIDYAHDQAFSQVWSLCVEEHFYLVLPLLILLLMRRPRFGKAVAVILGILCFGIAIRTYIYVHQVQVFPRDDDAFSLAYVEKIYYPTHTRLDGLLVGVTLAIIKTFRPAWWQRAMSHGYLLLVSGLALCGCAMWLFSDRLSFPGRRRWLPDTGRWPWAPDRLQHRSIQPAFQSPRLWPDRGPGLQRLSHAQRDHASGLHTSAKADRSRRLGCPGCLLCVQLSGCICPVPGH